MTMVLLRLKLQSLINMLEQKNGTQVAHASKTRAQFRAGRAPDQLRRPLGVNRTHAPVDSTAAHVTL
jgi:hypothetical protein